MSFRRRLIAIVLIVAVIIGLIYIGTETNKRRELDQPDTYENVETVYFWYSDKEMTDFFTAAAVAFHEANSDVRVIPVLVDEIEYLESINEASLGGEDFPDLFLLSNDSLEKAYLSGLASEVRDVKGVLNTDYFPKTALDAVTYRDKFTAYPLFFETSVLLYNKTYLEDWVSRVNEGLVVDTGDYGDGVGFEDEDLDLDRDLDDFEYFDDYSEGTVLEAGITLEDLIPGKFTDIQKFAENYEAPQDVEAVLKWDVTDVFYNYLFVGNSLIVGGDTGDDIANISINNPEAIASMRFYQDMNQYFSIDAETSAYASMLNEFLDGKFVFTIVTSDAISKVKASVEKRSDEMLEAMLSGAETIPNLFEFGYAKVPDINDELKSRSLSITNAIAINGYSEKKTAANRFAAFLCTEYAEKMYIDTGKIASCSKVESYEEAVEIFRNEYEKSIPLPKIVETSNLWVQVEVTFTEVWQGAEVTGMMTKLSRQILSQLGRLN